MKVKSRLYRGIEFVCVDELPADQQTLLQSSYSYPERINILVEGKITRNCILYTVYSDWYIRVFKTSVAPALLPANEKENTNAGLVLEKV